MEYVSRRKQDYISQINVINEIQLIKTSVQFIVFTEPKTQEK